MRIVVIEDEKPAARLLVREIERCGFSVVAVLHSVSESVNWLRTQAAPDLIFADIQLVDGLSFEIFEQLEVSAQLIFATAYDQYALRAFKFNSVDYLLKPIDIDELRQAIDKFQNLRREGNHVDWARLKKLYFKPVYKQRFTVNVGAQLKIVPVDHIECFYKMQRGVFVHTAEKRNYLVEESALDQLMELLDPELFFRVNRKQIVAVKHIAQISVYMNSRLKLKMNNYHEQEIIVSRDRVSDFKNWLNQK